MNSSEFELLIENKIDEWANLHAENGDIMPTDKAQLENLFYTTKMRNVMVSVPERMEAREILRGRGLTIKEPVTMEEVLDSMGAKRYAAPYDIEGIIEHGFMELVLIFSSRLALNRAFMRNSGKICGQLSVDRCSVNNRELYTVNNAHIKYLLETDYYKVPTDKSTAYSVVYDVA